MPHLIAQQCRVCELCSARPKFYTYTAERGEYFEERYFKNSNYWSMSEIGGDYGYIFSFAVRASFPHEVVVDMVLDSER